MKVWKVILIECIMIDERWSDKTFGLDAQTRTDCITNALRSFEKHVDVSNIEAVEDSVQDFVDNFIF